MRQVGRSPSEPAAHTAAPVPVTVAADSVWVGDLLVPGAGEPHARAVTYVAAMVAAPTFRPVWAEISSGRARWLVLIQPDGSISEIQPGAGAEGAGVPAELLAMWRDRPRRGARRVRRSSATARRRLRGAAAGPVLAAALVVALVALGGVAVVTGLGADPVVATPSADAAGGFAAVDGRTPVQAVANPQPVIPGARVAPAPLRLRVSASTGPATLDLTITASRFPVRAMLVARSLTGQVRRVPLVLRGPVTRATLAGLTPGRWRWQVVGPDVRAAGSSLVAPAPPAPAAPPEQDVPPAPAPAPAAPQPQPGGPGPGGKGDGGDASFDTSGDLPPGEGPVGINERKERSA